MTDYLVRRIARQPRSVWVRIGLGVLWALVAVGVRLASQPYVGAGAPFIAFMLAVLVASVQGGVAGGGTCLALLVVATPLVLIPTNDPAANPRRLLGLLFFLASSGVVIWIIALLRAALAREVAAREAERLLRLELHHRVKNTLAVVQSLADQTFRTATDTDAARADFASRLAALAQAHDVLVDARWGEVTLEALAARALKPFRPGAAERLRMEGPPVTVQPDAAVPLALCLHELATNAAKHGALSNGSGRVHVRWSVDEDARGRRRVSLDWTETGGPPLAPPSREGFGTRLLSRALASQPNAEARLAFPPEGARWSAAFDLAGDG